MAHVAFELYQGEELIKKLVKSEIYDISVRLVALGEVKSLQQIAF